MNTRHSDGFLAGVDKALTTRPERFSAAVEWHEGSVVRVVVAVGYASQQEADAAAWRIAYSGGYKPPRWWQFGRRMLENNPPDLLLATDAELDQARSSR